MVKGVIEYAKHLVGAVLIDRDRNASKISDKICTLKLGLGGYV
jgi:hypothetical protein